MNLQTITMNANNILIYLPEIFTALFIIIEFYIIFLNKNKPFSWKSVKSKIWDSKIWDSLMCIMPVYFCALVLGSVWIEYPTSDKNYNLQDGKWVSFNKRILHKPFGFNGYGFTSKIYPYVVYPLDNNAGVKIYFHIKETDIESILYRIGPSYNKSFKEKVEKDLIIPILTKLVYITPREVMSDYHKRLNLFKESLKPVKIDVDDVEFIPIP